jgi:chaperonin GroEL (HSP60 family)
MGLQISTGKATDMWPDVIEPLRTKKQAILSATEAANMILRIDDVIQAATFSQGPSEDEMAGMSDSMMDQI